MKNNFIIQVKDISDIKKVINNQVLIRTAHRNEDKKTDSGIILIAGTETDWRPAEHTNRISEVVLVPEKLHFSHRSADHDSMPWDTDMQIQVGDMVWHDFLAVHNCPVVLSDNQPDEEYKMISYFDLYVVQRGDEVIPLNGFCLCEEVCEDRLSDMQVTEPKVDKRLGKVAYLGMPNRSYRYNRHSVNRAVQTDFYLNDPAPTDEADVAVGDVFTKRRHDIHVMLESEDHTRFDGDKLFFVTQRKDMYSVVHGA